MDERLLHHYNTELRHIREMAGEFAREFPKIAGRLALDPAGREICPDPYVERLLEGFAFLCARVHQRLDDEFPRFTQSLLETVFPQYLCPIPSMAVIRFDHDPQDAGLADGQIVPRNTILRSGVGKDQRTACTFRTGHPVRLLPLEVAEVRYFSRDTLELSLPPHLQAKAALRIRLRATAGLKFSQVTPDPVTFFIHGADEIPTMIYEEVLAHSTGLVVQSPEESGKNLGAFPTEAIRKIGFDGDHALLPVSPRGFEGYRLLREYFAFPQRFLFFELAGFGAASRECPHSQLDLVIALDEPRPQLEGQVDSACLQLFCTPAINLFTKRTDRIAVTNRFAEHHIVPDRNRPIDFEVYEVEEVTGFGSTSQEEQEFRPFYQAHDGDPQSGAFYTTNRVRRMLTEKQRKKGRTYTGTELYLSLVDSSAAPYRSTLRQLGIRALCTNRHLPMQMPVGLEKSDFDMELSAPVKSIRCISGPTIPRPSLAEGKFSWRLISHLSLNYLSLLDQGGDEGALGLQEILGLYIDANDRHFARQIRGVHRIDSRPILRRVKTPGPITFARGLGITVEFDELAFEGTGSFILGAVLEQFFAKYVALNSFTETTIRTQQRGEIVRWPVRMGKRQIL